NNNKFRITHGVVGTTTAQGIWKSLAEQISIKAKVIKRGLPSFLFHGLLLTTSITLSQFNQGFFFSPSSAFL
ncbi:hypothetical protein ACJX0J_037832, partial [Zea mays]